MKIRRFALMAAILLTMPGPLSGKERNIIIATNMVEWLYLGTINGEVGLGLDRHWSIHLDGSLNPFSWSGPKGAFQDRELTLALNGKFWPWYTFSGWHLGGSLQYSRYNRGGFSSPHTEEGDALGIGVDGGYSLMINRWLNIDFSLGLWGGMTQYKTYSAPRCGKLTDMGQKLFILPNKISISLVLNL